MADRKSQGRHGGNHSPADKGDSENPNARETRNTDVESLAGDRNVSRAGKGRTSRE